MLYRWGASCSVACLRRSPLSVCLVRILPDARFRAYIIYSEEEKYVCMHVPQVRQSGHSTGDAVEASIWLSHLENVKPSVRRLPVAPTMQSLWYVLPAGDDGCSLVSCGDGGRRGLKCIAVEVLKALPWGACCRIPCRCPAKATMLSDCCVFCYYTVPFWRAMACRVGVG